MMRVLMSEGAVFLVVELVKWGLGWKRVLNCTLRCDGMPYILFFVPLSFSIVVCGTRLLAWHVVSIMCTCTPSLVATLELA